MKEKAYLLNCLFYLSLLLILSNVTSVQAAFDVAEAKYGGGSGEPDDPYLVFTAEQMNTIGTEPNDWDSCFKLMADIDLGQYTGTEFNIIGESYNNCFTGVFDCNNHTISNFSYACSEKDYVGIFGYVGKYEESVIMNLKLVDPNINAETGEYIGALIGYGNQELVTNCSIEGRKVVGNNHVGGISGINFGLIDNCSFSGSIEGNIYVGGLVGTNAGNIIECSSYGEVTGFDDIGGLIGYNIYADIVSCYSNSIVTGEEDVGGLIGWNNSQKFSMPHGGFPPGFISIREQSHISSCYCTGSVEGYECVGGLIGCNDGLVEFCYSASHVTGIPCLRTGRGVTYYEEPVFVGGLIGNNSYGVVLLSYWDTQASGIFDSTGGKGMTTEQLMDAQTFSGWGYLYEWIIDDGNDYPHLAWEGTEGKLITEDYERYSGGTGDPNEPYIIDNAEDFVDVMYNPGDWDKYFMLTNDIDMNNVDPNKVLPIGVFGKPFSGIFDGNNHTISNYEYLSETESYIGIFGSIGQGIYYSYAEPTIHGPNSLVLNLNVEDVNISGYCYVGGLVGYNDGQIRNCALTGDVNCIFEDAGGLVGYNLGEITDCNTQCNIIAQRIIGGLVGYNGGPITKCFSSGNIGNGSQTYVGGLVGRNVSSISSSFSNSIVTGESCIGGLAGDSYSGINNCYATGIVEGKKSAAGLVGAGGNKYVSYCYSSCIVTGQGDIFGLLSYAYSNSNIISCFWDIDLCSVNDGVGNLVPDPETVAGLSTVQMQTKNTFIDAGWDFEGESENGLDDIWWIDNGNGYPRLWWESLQNK